jgi:hypothetical protein
VKAGLIESLAAAATIIESYVLQYFRAAGLNSAISFTFVSLLKFIFTSATVRIVD